MITIIRVEHPESGRGIFRHFSTQPDYYRIDGGLSERHMNFPIPYEEREITFDKDHYCAFKSIEQIQKWLIPEDFKFLVEEGFKVLMIDVSKCQIGEYQIAYKKEHIMQTIDITSLFES